MTEQPSMRTDRRDDEHERRSVEERRAELIQAALEVIAADGLGRATTRRITDHADLALGAFHYAFRSKDELLEAVIGRLGDHLDAVLRSAMTDPNLPLDAAVEQLVVGYWAAVEEAPDLQLAHHELTVHALRHPRLRQLATDQHEAHVHTVAEALAKVVGAPEREQRDELARFLLGTLDGLALQWLQQSDQPSAVDQAAATMRSLARLQPGAA